MMRGDVGPYVPEGVTESGRDLGSFIWFGTAPGCRRDVFCELNRYGFTGIASYIFVAERVPWMKDYVGLAILGRADVISLNKQKVAYKRSPAGWSPCYLGLQVSGWDGSDLFMSRCGTNDYILATQRVVDVAVAEGLTNIRMTNVERYFSVWPAPELPRRLKEPPEGFELIPDDE